jgi:acetolactate synthase-1/2/3 large subunit
MERLGIDTAFGMPGAHILPVYDALYDSSVQVILAKHEQGAAFMAGGQARARGCIGACIATAGPGATNLVTGIANAYADGLPVLAITGETPTYIFGKGGLQESSGEGGSIDQMALFKGISRYAKTIERPEYLAQVLRQAAQALLAEHPGPVVLSIPFDVQKAQVPADIIEQISMRRASPRPAMPADIAQLAEYLHSAQRPVILAGQGVLASGAEVQLARLSRDWVIPVATSLKGKGGFNEHDPLALATLGVTSGGLAYEYFSQHADLVLMLGAGFNERTSYLWDERLFAGKRLVQIDSNPSQLGRAWPVDLAIQADLKLALDALHQELLASGTPSRSSQPIEAELARLRQSIGQGYQLFQTGFSLVEAFFVRLARAFPAGIQIFDDNIIFAQNFLSLSPANRFYPNTGISSLGHAIPAAIGAQCPAPMPSFAILGDGGFQMCCMELMTAANYGIPLNVVLFNNATMGLIRKNQHQQYQGRFISCDFENPDFAQLAAAFGMDYLCLNGHQDLDRPFVELDLRQGLNLIEIPLDKGLYPHYSSKR